MLRIHWPAALSLLALAAPIPAFAEGAVMDTADPVGLPAAYVGDMTGNPEKDTLVLMPSVQRVEQVAEAPAVVPGQGLRPDGLEDLPGADRASLDR